MSWKAIFMAICLLYFVFPAIADDDGIINGKDDSEFARALAEKGYHDFAEEISSRLSKSKHLSPAERIKAKLLQATLLQVQAERENDVEKKQKLYNEAVEVYKKVSLETSDEMQKADIEFEIGNLLVSRGQYWVFQAEDAEPEEQQKLHAMALPLLREAEGAFSRLKMAYENAGADLEEKENIPGEKERVKKAELRYHAWYGVCRALYFQGMAGDKGTLDRCLKQLESFIWDYEGLLGAFYASMLRGMVLAEKERFTESIDSYDSVLKGLQGDAHPKVQMLLLQAIYYKTRTYNKGKLYADAVKSLSEFQEMFEKKFNTRLDEYTDGQAALLEMCKAWVAQGEYSKAIELAQKVGEKKTYWGLMAKKSLQKWGNMDPNALRNVKSAYLVASGLWSQDKHQEAILSFLNVLQYMKPGDKSEIEMYGLDSLEKMAQSFWFLKLYQESALCYRACAQEYKNYQKVTKSKQGDKRRDIAAKSAYWAYRAYRENYKISQDPQDKKGYDEMREFLLANWKNSGFAKNLAFDAARDKEMKAQDAKTSEESIALYRQAAQGYGDVPSDADLYEQAIISVGKCYYKISEIALKDFKAKNKGQKDDEGPLPKEVVQDYKKAIEEFEKYLKFAGRNPIEDDETRLARRKESLAQAYFYLGRIQMRLQEDEKAHKSWQELYEKYPNQRDMVVSAIYLAIRSHLRKKNLGEAEKLIQLMEKLYGTEPTKNPTYESSCYYFVGRDYLRKAEKEIEDIRKKNPGQLETPEETALAYQKGIENLQKWLAWDRNVPSDSKEWIADRFTRFAAILAQKDDDEGAKKWYAQAFQIYRKLVSGISNPEQAKNIRIKITECSLKIGDWERSIFVLYPLFHEDKDIRAKKMDDIKKQLKGRQLSADQVIPSMDALYLDYVAQALAGLAETPAYSDPQKLYYFLLSHVRRDLVDELEEFEKQKYTDELMFEEYRDFVQKIGWMKISGDVKEYEEKQKQALQILEQRFKKELEAYNKEVSAGKKPKALKYAYKEKYKQLIQNEFPEKDHQKKLPTTPEQAQARAKKLSMFMALKFSSKLVDNIPRYKNPDINFGFYDNPMWWDAKYRQMLLIYLSEDPVLAGKLIISLQLQQSNLGGPKYKKKFTDLLEKTKK